MGVEGVSVPIAALQLGISLNIMQLDGNPGDLAQYVYPKEEYQSPLGITIHLLFKPGHYEVLYVGGTAFLERNVHIPVIGSFSCSSCGQQAPLRTSELRSCFHRLCFTCVEERGVVS